MKNKRRILAGLLAAVLTVPLFAGGAQITAAAEAAGKTLDVVFTHDTHSHLNSFSTVIDGESTEVGGFARIKTVIDEQKAENPDTLVALLDVMLPDIDGFEVCRRIRATGSKMGILMLSAKSQEMDKITGLMTGADDYVTKPFSPAELLARVDALYRRIGGSENTEDVLSSGPFVLHLRSRTLDKNSEHIRLTQTEFAIMKLFMENPGRALSREDILHAVWGADYNGEVKIVDVNIRRLRIKIEDDATEPEYITTVWGYGYKWGY